MRTCWILLLTLLSLQPLLGQNNAEQIARQRAEIARLERQIAQREQEISSLKRDRSTAEKRARTLARQIEDRNHLLSRSRDQERLLQNEVERLDSASNSLHASLLMGRERYAAMVREAYRNYRHNNFLTYIFSAENFSQIARRIANLREVASMRDRQIRLIDSMERETNLRLEELAVRQGELDSVRRSLNEQKRRLQRDADAARSNINQLSRREKEKIRQRNSQQEELNDAIAELRLLTRGNSAGASFSASTRNLRLPVVGGKVKRYKGNMAEVVGQRGAKIITIYEGKVVDIKQNRITGKYDVYIAHGEYITSYSNLASVGVEKGAILKRNQTIGTIGVTVDPLTLENQYKLIFGIYAPDPKVSLSAAKCFSSK